MIISPTSEMNYPHSISSVKFISKYPPVIFPIIKVNFRVKWTFICWKGNGLGDFEQKFRDISIGKMDLENELRQFISKIEEMDVTQASM